MESFLDRLITRFEWQAKFAESYAPVYARLFEQFGVWCMAHKTTADLLIEWLIDTAGYRNPFDVPLLMMSSLHDAVLAEHPAAAELAAYYPSANDGEARPLDGALEEILRQATWALRDEIAPFLQNGFVQTNEWGRGTSWLLPLAFVRGWDGVRVVDLGASAGLNLLADQLSYQAQDSDGRPLTLFGRASDTLFSMTCRGEIEPLAQLPDIAPRPKIVNRFGCDINPFHIRNEVDERRLRSYVWTDRTERLERLEHGLAILREVQASDAPVELHQVTLPDGLPEFLPRLEGTDLPVLLYNTYITAYFPDKRNLFRQLMHEWAMKQPFPVLWVQCEAGQKDAPTDEQPPERGWCAWTADLWQNGTHHQFFLGWIHPHGQNAQFSIGLRNWSAFCSLPGTK